VQPTIVRAVVALVVSPGLLSPNTLFSAILNDVNAKGAAGAGFTPIPA
jgi:hypothetical protein